MTTPKTLEQMAADSRADAGLSQNTDRAIAYETGFEAGFQAALASPEVLAMRDALEKFDAIHFTDSGQSCAFGSDVACKALAAFDRLTGEVGG